MKLRVHATEARSRANGPGARFVVWVQGCTLGCPGCFNPATHPTGIELRDAPTHVIGREIEVAVLVDEILAAHAAAPIDGVSLSGGEPLQQAAAAVELLDGVRAAGLSTLAFSGYTIDEIREIPHGPEVLARLDVLIDGRYVSTERLASSLRGSANQRIHTLTSRYSRADVEATPVAEIRIGPTGDVVLTGVNPLKLRH